MSDEGGLVNEPQWQGEWRIRPGVWLSLSAACLAFYTLMAVLIVRWW